MYISSKFKISVLAILFVGLTAFSQEKKRQLFDTEKDLLLLHYDFKTDVDDLHAAAAFATLVANPTFSDLNYHVVAGTYGIQEGLYVPPNDLCGLAFREKWSDAHTDFDKAQDEVKLSTIQTLNKGGAIWIAEGGQSDFSAALVKKILKENPDLDSQKLIHIVQHSDWNEKVTAEASLNYAKEKVNYHKIPDGNAMGNGTPGFRSDKKIDLERYIQNKKLLNVWKLAIEIANKYNGAEGRYLNKSMESGGLDFSDFSEVCWLLGLEELKDADDFFEKYAMQKQSE